MRTDLILLIGEVPPSPDEVVAVYRELREIKSPSTHKWFPWFRLQHSPDWLHFRPRPFLL